MLIPLTYGCVTNRPKLTLLINMKFGWGLAVTAPLCSTWGGHVGLYDPFPRWCTHVAASWYWLSHGPLPGGYPPGWWLGSQRDGRGCQSLRACAQKLPWHHFHHVFGSNGPRWHPIQGEGTWTSPIGRSCRRVFGYVSTTVLHNRAFWTPLLFLTDGLI